MGSMGYEVMEDGHKAKSQIPTGNHSSYTVLGKRKILNECNDTNCSSLKNYSNFMRSGPPKRILFHENGEWNDFPQGLVDMVREDFLAKKAIIKVQFDDITVMLDMLYMVQLDMITCTPKPIAWIDEAGSCYFPELNSLNLQIDQLCQNQLDKDTVSCGSEFKGAREIKLCIGIDLNGINNCNVEEYMEESNFGTKRAKVEGNSVEDVHESSDTVKIMPLTDDKPQNGAENNKHTQLEPAYASLDADAIENLFHMGMKPFLNVSIHEITKCSSNLLQMRLELFEKQVELTSKYRGSSNVQYAWLPCSKDAVSCINSYGIWHGGAGQRIKYGNGVHLSVVNNAYASASEYAAEENGLYYMVFCRVILGNVEVLHPGSQQWHSSSEQFDSGVDDLHNPRCYIIWHMNASTQIFPEYVVSFKMPSAVQGSEGGDENKCSISGAIALKPHGQLQTNNPSLPKKEASGSAGSCSKAPTNPSMRFNQLFEAIRDKVSAEAMNAVYAHYNQLQIRRISRDVFFAKLIEIVGDQVLRSTINSLNGRMASDNAGPPEVPGEGREKQD